MLHPNFVILGVLLQFLGGLSYFFDTLKGKVKPNRVSFFLWSLAPFIAFTAEIKQGVGIQSLLTFIVGFSPLTIFIASFFNKKSFWQLGPLDWICGALSLTGLLLWYFTRVGNIAIAFSIVSDGLAYLPTMVKGYHHPETENHWLYSLGVVNAGITLLTIDTWNFAHYAFPLYIFLADAIMVSLIKFNFGQKLQKVINT